MKELRNPNDRLFCCNNAITGCNEIMERGWMTVLQRNHGRTVKMPHSYIHAV